MDRWNALSPLMLVRELDNVSQRGSKMAWQCSLHGPYAFVCPLLSLSLVSLALPLSVMIIHSDVLIQTARVDGPYPLLNINLRTI